MIIVMSNAATEGQIESVIKRIEEKGLEANVSRGTERTVIGAIGDERSLDPELLESLPGVEQALHIVKPYKIVAREWHKEDTVIDIQGNLIGGKQIQIISGPCSVETPDQMEKSAKAVKAAGVRLMRGGAFKPRTSPYTFQGTGVEGLPRSRCRGSRASCGRSPWLSSGPCRRARCVPSPADSWPTQVVGNAEQSPLPRGR